MIHQPPAGARDLLPLEVTQKGWINDRLQGVFQRWGYERIVTSSIEWLDSLVAGGAIDPETVIQLRGTGAGVLGLRPELTASIARAAVTRMADSSYPQRICYRANVFRKPPANYHGRQMEFYQAGVELLFAGGVLADAEILLLLADCFDSLGLKGWHLILGEAGLTGSLLSAFPGPLKALVRHCLAHLDRVTLENLDYPSPELKERAMMMFHLRGEPNEVLSLVSLMALDGEGQEALDNLKTLVELVNKTRGDFPLTLDLSFVQTFDYYTGIVFKAISSNGGQLRSLAQGGRYDRLLGLYHPQGRSAPGVGFSTNIEDLYASLLGGDSLPRETPSIDCLVIARGTTAYSAAMRCAQSLRQSDPALRVSLDLGGRADDSIRAYASYRQISRLVWVEPDGTQQGETI
ncbi:MAG: ATP phosphoribosyltransferase regulatory subunit [Chroococcopsis gigantea SAG 12.99]|jgi:ATP phosphoribosyltransferase regulatory subunit|nr:ATP phosphoribosyltransferase regulatory subunit [Chlorogloea purpurea SAG 13.99]MDV3000227.1 ATP phosphoribosyltransferase regulatory subunit [Chroococcopsis gigantea SAG 12.99]